MMSQQTTLQERVRMGELAQQGLTDRQIAVQVGWSEHTVRKWRRKHTRAGRAGLASQLGRPRRGALSAFPSEISATLRRWREAHPGWGPRTLQVELRLHFGETLGQVPSVASIGRFLHEQGLSRPYEKHRPLPAPVPQTAQEPHQVWEMDGRGYSQVAGVGLVVLLNLNDRCSHARLLSYPVWVGEQRCSRHPDTEDYQTALRLAFSQWGMPHQLQVDHESVFVDNHSKSPFPTRLHLWLIALGIEVVFIRLGRPTDQGLTERSHQLWEAQCLLGQHYDSWFALYDTLRQRRDFLNYHLPCSTLNDCPPLQAFPQANHSGRAYRPEYEQDLLDLQRVWTYLAQGRWFRLSSKAGTFCLGGQVYYLGHPWHSVPLEITFDPADSCLLCYDAAGQLAARRPIQGITHQSLMGALPPWAQLPAFQLALPFQWADSQPVRLLETLPV